jgi:signal transduction histidine kinase
VYVRTRLALWFALIMAVALAGLSLGVYNLTRHNLLAEIQQDVQERSQALAAAARPEPGETTLRPLQLDAFSAPDVFVEVLSADGKPLARSANLESRTLPFQPQAIGTGEAEEVHVGGLPLFMSGRAVHEGATVRGYVLVARSPLAVYVALDRMRRLLYPGAVAALMVTGVAGWLVARRAMRPLERLAASAAQIASTQDHAARVASRETRTEIGRLAATINGMLEALGKAHRQVREVNESQRRFLADVSHELRTPLTIMLSSLDLLDRMGQVDPAFAAETLAGLRIEAERMARLVTQLLVMARGDRDPSIDRVPILIADVAGDACRQCAANQDGVEVEWQGLATVRDAVVEGDGDDLKELFLILLDNAVKYTPPGGTVQVIAATNETGLSVSVVDNGIGIPAEDISRVFDRFYRAANARARGGTGLGLAIARQIAQQHGGTVEVESEVGRGSRFTVTLPRIA